MGRVIAFWAKIWLLGPSDSLIRFHSVGFCKTGLHKQAHPFFRSTNKKLKLGTGSRIRVSLTIPHNSRFENFQCVRGHAIFFAEICKFVCCSVRTERTIPGLFSPQLLWVLYDIHARTPNFSWSSVRPCHNTRGTMIPVPQTDSSSSSVRLPYPYPKLVWVL